MTLGKYFQNNGEGSTKVNCVVCDSNRYTPLFHIPPRRIVTCSNCDHEYVNPIFSPKDIPECIFHSTDESSIGTQTDITYLAKIFHKYDIKERKLLDLGCGLGRLESGLIGLGWAPQSVYLMDNSERNVKVARKKYPLSTVICGDAQERIGFNDYFDCILMVEFLEHLSNPKEALKNALTALKNDGILIIRGLPNNDSLEAFIGRERWKMRQFIHHYHFFNHSTFSTFVKDFADVSVLEFGTFLQEGYHFYDVARIARNIGVVKESRGDEHTTYDDNVIMTAELTNLVLAKIESVDFEDYKHRDKLPKRQLTLQLSTEDIKNFFNTISLNQFLSPDFSVVMRKKQIK